MIEHAIEVNGASLRYETVGDGSPIIILHGGPGIGYQYLAPELKASLSKRSRLVFYDQRGSGESTGADDSSFLNIATFMKDLDAVLAAFDLERAILLGHSFGGLLAMKYAIQHPERVTALILVDPDPASKALWNRFPTAVDQEISAIQSKDGWISDPDLLARYFELTLQPFFAAHAAPAGFGYRFIRTRPENLFKTAAAVRSSLGDWDFHGFLHEIACPTLLVCGETAIFPEKAVANLHRGIRYSTLVKLASASHFPSIEAPEAFFEAVSQFLTCSSRRNVRLKRRQKLHLVFAQEKVSARKYPRLER